MTMNATWAEQKVIESAGLCMDDATPRIINLAAIALDRCYYIDCAAEWLIAYLRRNNISGHRYSN
jgi:hypothetical protein